MLQSFGVIAPVPRKRGASAGDLGTTVSAFSHATGPHFDAAAVQQVFVRFFTTALRDCTAFMVQSSPSLSAGGGRRCGPATTFDSDVFVASCSRDVKVCGAAWHMEREVHTPVWHALTLRCDGCV